MYAIVGLFVVHCRSAGLLRGFLLALIPMLLEEFGDSDMASRDSSLTLKFA